MEHQVLVEFPLGDVVAALVLTDRLYIAPPLGLLVGDEVGAQFRTDSLYETSVGGEMFERDGKARSAANVSVPPPRTRQWSGAPGNRGCRLRRAWLPGAQLRSRL